MSRRTPARRSPQRGGSHAVAWLVLVLLVAAVAGYWFYRHRPAAQPTQSAANGCGAALPDFHGAAVTRARTAEFRTVEQLQRQRPNGQPLVRVQARLLEYSVQGRDYRLLLGSLVDPRLTLAAFLPAGACARDEADGALYDELREDMNLRFGPVTDRRTVPAPAPTVVVTGVVTLVSGRLALRPVLDFKASENAEPSTSH
ncbi:MAG: hypothetical protein ACRD01_09585 [Terriglobales bacterium]